MPLALKVIIQAFLVEIIIIDDLYLTGVAFNFISSPNITVNQTGVFHCYVDTEGVSIQWQVNGTLSTSEKVTSLGVVTTGAATSNSSLLIPGVVENDQTIVTCIASGLVNGKQYFNSSSTTLYIQGMCIVKVDTDR